MTKLTKVQLDYLEEMAGRNWLDQGWGGYGSTLTVRILEERGLITLQRIPRNGRERWRAKIRGSGREALRAAGR